MSLTGFEQAGDTGPDDTGDGLPEVIEPCPETGVLPSFTSADGSNWETQCDSISSAGIPGWFGLIVFLMLAAGIGITIWKVSTARRMARDSGMSVGDATAMTLLDEDGLSATYLASNLRASTPRDTPRSTSAAERLQELTDLRTRGLITQAEHDQRRARIIDGI